MPTQKSDIKRSLQRAFQDYLASLPENCSPDEILRHFHEFAQHAAGVGFYYQQRESRP